MTLNNIKDLLLLNNKELLNRIDNVKLALSILEDTEIANLYNAISSLKNTVGSAQDAIDTINDSAIADMKEHLQTIDAALQTINELFDDVNDDITANSTEIQDLKEYINTTLKLYLELQDFIDIFDYVKTPIIQEEVEPIGIEYYQTSALPDGNSNLNRPGSVFTPGTSAHGFKGAMTLSLKKYKSITVPNLARISGPCYTFIVMDSNTNIIIFSINVSGTYTYVNDYADTKAFVVCSQGTSNNSIETNTIGVYETLIGYTHSIIIKEEYLIQSVKDALKHSNRSVLDKLTESSDGDLLYNNLPIKSEDPANKDTLDKLTTSEDGTLLFDGEEIKGGGSDITVSEAENNAIQTNEDGIFVQDYSQDIEDLHSQVLNVNEYVTGVDNYADTPVGHILQYLGKTAPAHYLICDGAEYNITDYPSLVLFFTLQYGKSNYFGGDGQTTFCVPSLNNNSVQFVNSQQTVVNYIQCIKYEPTYYVANINQNVDYDVTDEDISEVMEGIYGDIHS